MIDAAGESRIHDAREETDRIQFYGSPDRRRGARAAGAVAARPSGQAARHGFFAIHPAAIRILEFSAGDSKV
jgi:hypothetical protein